MPCIPQLRITCRRDLYSKCTRHKHHAHTTHTCPTETGYLHAAALQRHQPTTQPPTPACCRPPMRQPNASNNAGGGTGAPVCYNQTALHAHESAADTIVLLLEQSVPSPANTHTRQRAPNAAAAFQHNCAHSQLVAESTMRMQFDSTRPAKAAGTPGVKKRLLETAYARDTTLTGWPRCLRVQGMAKHQQVQGMQRVQGQGMRQPQQGQGMRQPQ
jgi:hypothetical protein